MMYLAILAIVVIAWYPFTEQLWTRYLAVMCLRQARDFGKLPEGAKPHATVSAVIGLLYDYLYNMTYAVIVFLDLPREFTVSARLERYLFGHKAWRLRKVDGKWKLIKVHISAGTGWFKWHVHYRIRLAKWFARNMLDPYPHDGPHLKP